MRARSEASSLPSLFVAPVTNVNAPTPALDTQNHSQVPVARSRPLTAGFFNDEAYIAPVDPSKSTNALSDASFSEAQISYYNLLRHRFRLLRSTLRCTPPASAIAALDDAHPISLPNGNESARKEWRRLVLAVDPQMVQLACMDQSSVLGVLEIVARELSDIVRSGDANRIRRMGAWAWGLLGRCRQLGELTTEEVGAIRDLGKRTVKISHKFQQAKRSRPAGVANETGSDGEETYEPNDTAPEVMTGQEVLEPGLVEDGSAMVDATDQTTLEAAKTRLQAKLVGDSDVPSTANSEGGDSVQQTRAMFDMIVTVVGEFFGQRDLLEAREIWTL